MDNMAKSIAKKEGVMSSGEVTVIVVKNKYQQQNSSSQESQPQGHEALLTESDNMQSSDQTEWAERLSRKFKENPSAEKASQAQ